jgi:hypothetical protein
LTGQPEQKQLQLCPQFFRRLQGLLEVVHVIEQVFGKPNRSTLTRHINLGLLSRHTATHLMTENDAVRRIANTFAPQPVVAVVSLGQKKYTMIFALGSPDVGSLRLPRG